MTINLLYVVANEGIPPNSSQLVVYKLGTLQRRSCEYTHTQYRPVNLKTYAHTQYRPVNLKTSLIGTPGPNGFKMSSMAHACVPHLFWSLQ